MKGFIKNKILLFLAVFLGLFGLSKKASAGLLDLITKPLEVLLSFLTFLTFAIGISYAALSISSAILNWVASPDFIKVSYTNNDMVLAGWTTVRDFTNLLFILVMVAIGVATALRMKDYQVQKTLPRLIAIAVLINFTPVICGVIIDASNIIMNFFFSAGTAGYGQFLSLMKGSYEVFAGSFSSLIHGGLANLINGVFFMQLLFVVAFNFISAFILLIFAFLLIIRHVALWILIILAPLAFFAYILPATRSMWKTWWKQFIQWCFVGVGGAFFLYLTQVLMSNVSKLIAKPGSMIAGGVTFRNQLSEMLLMAVPLIFLGMGLFITMSTSAMGASMVTGTARKLQHKTTALMSKGGRIMGEKIKGVGRAGVGFIAAKGGATVGATMEKLGTYTPGWGLDESGQKIRGFKNLGWAKRGAASVAAVLPRTIGRSWRWTGGRIFEPQQEMKESAEAEKKATGRSLEDVKWMFDHSPTRGMDAGYVAAMIKNKQLEEFLKDPMASANRLNRVIDVLTHNKNLKPTKDAFMVSTSNNQGIGKILLKAIDDSNQKKDPNERTIGGVTEDEKDELLDKDEEDKAKELREDGTLLRRKILAEADAKDITEYMPKLKGDFKDLVAGVAARFWNGNQAGALGKKFGVQAVDAIQEKIDDMGMEKFFSVNPKTGTTYGSLQLAKYVSSSAGAEMGFAGFKKADGKVVSDRDLRKLIRDKQTERGPILATLREQRKQRDAMEVADEAGRKKKQKKKDSGSLSDFGVSANGSDSDYNQQNPDKKDDGSEEDYNE